MLGAASCRDTANGRGARPAWSSVAASRNEEHVTSTAPQHPSDVRGFFDRWVETANGGDWASFAALLHPDAVLEDPMSPEPAVGREEVVARAQAQYDPFPGGRTTVVGAPFRGLDGRALAYRWRFTGRHTRPVDPPGFAATGRDVELDGASVLVFEDGLVRHVTLFFDTTDVARQLLAAPPAGSRLEAVIALMQRIRVRLQGTERS